MFSSENLDPKKVDFVFEQKQWSRLETELCFPVFGVDVLLKVPVSRLNEIQELQFDPCLSDSKSLQFYNTILTHI